MHYLMLVTPTMLPGETSLAAREQVFSTLIADDRSCGNCGCWSGLLAQTVLGDTFRNKLAAKFQDSATAEEADALWQESGGSGPSPLNRDDSEQLGYVDDAMPLDQTLYDRLVSNCEGQIRHQENGNHCEFIDLDDEDLDESFIGRKWIAVVDYHS